MTLDSSACMEAMLKKKDWNSIGLEIRIRLAD